MSTTDGTRRLERFTVALVLLVALVPMATFAVLDTNMRDEASQALENALERMKNRDRGTTEIQERKRVALNTAEQKEKRLREISHEKRLVRLHIASLRRAVANLKDNHGIDVSNPEKAVVVMEEEKENLKSFVRYLNARGIGRAEDTTDLGDVVVRRMLYASLGDTVEMDLADRALEKARSELLTMVIDAQDLPVALEVLEHRHEELLTEYHEVLGDYTFAMRQVQLSEAELLEIKRVLAGVRGEIASLQGELARMEAQIREKAERQLQDKGLFVPSEREGDFRQEFIWPVVGRISAGFFEQSYKAVFGIPHYGIDIVTPQGTPIRSAAHGIVYSAKDNGYGYTYVLIGHRGGYATLYGHLSGLNVVAGQEVAKGQLIGSSGGTPGTRGAGLMTTGAHLHFEVIKDGTNVNPTSVLP